MKKKFREIVVDGKNYAWSARKHGDGGMLVKIWKDKKIIYEEHLSYDSMTPHFISLIIADLEIHMEDS